MRVVADITKRSSFKYDPPKDRPIFLSPVKRLEAVRIFKAVSHLVVIVTLITYIWGMHSYFASAPQLAVGVVEGASVSREEQELEKKLEQLEKQIKEYDQNIYETRQQKQSLQRDISLLENKIKMLELELKATDLQIKRLSARIKDTQSAIYESQLKIARQKEALSRSLQAIYENDNVSLLELMLAYASIADFFSNVNAVYALQVRAQAELDQVYALKAVLEDQEMKLAQEHEEQVALLLVQKAQKEDVDASRKAKAQLLALTQGKESLYQELKKAAEKTAAEIRAQLFRLRGGGELSFGEAYAFAKMAAKATGVRPALIMAVISQESALGGNVGQCRLADTTSGTTVGIKTGRKFPTGMHPTRDLPLFLEITRELGLNPESMPVSCPILSDGAYGGAMGIAQFLPSTWQIYKDRIRSIVGYLPSPWEPRSAFVANALYLADAGANAGTPAAEREAAARYYAGGNWKSRVAQYYASRVLDIASRFQEEINILERESRNNSR
jgi:peptidoglycan hydrolase CwlO-like protein